MLVTILATLAPVASAAWWPTVTDQRAYSRAVSDLGAGRLEQAEQRFNALLDRDPGCGMASHGLGVTRLRLGETAAAITTFTALTEAWPDRPEPWVGLSVARFAAQDFPGALAAGKAAVAADPGGIDAHAALQEAYLRIGDLDGARADLAAAEARLPPPVRACFAVQIAQEAGDDAGAKALLDTCRRAGTADLITAAISRTGDQGATAGALASRAGMDALVRMAQAVDLFNDADYAGSVEALNALLASRPGRGDARVLRARALHALGRDDQALEDLERAFGTGPWVDVHRSGYTSGILRKSDARRLETELARGAGLLVEILAKRGQVADATARLDTLSARFPDAPPIAVARARLAWSAGDLPGAWAALDAGLQLHPGAPDLLRAAGELAVEDPTGLTAAVGTALDRSADWRASYNLAVSQRKAGNPTACAETAAAALSRYPGLAPADHARVGLLAHRCAVDSGDLEAADAALGPAGGAKILRATTAYNHARLRFEAAVPDGALALLTPHLDPLPKEPQVATACAALALRAAVALEDWDRAIQVSASPVITAMDRHFLASHLAAADRAADAIPLLDGTCEIVGGDAAVRCAALLERLREE